MKSEKELFEYYLRHNRLPRNKQDKELFLDHTQKFKKSDLEKHKPDSPVQAAKFTPKLTKKYLNTVTPKDTLDIHQLTLEEARDKIEYFIKYAHTHTLSPVLLIHGKGHHSPGEAVLKKYVELELKYEMRDYIDRIVDSPRKLGGSGSKLIWIRL